MKVQMVKKTNLKIKRFQSKNNKMKTNLNHKIIIKNYKN
jgi:hypothetical protein